MKGLTTGKRSGVHHGQRSSFCPTFHARAYSLPRPNRRMPTRNVFPLNLFRCPGRCTLLIAQLHRAAARRASGRRTRRSATLRLPVTYSCIICYGFHTSHNSTDISTFPSPRLPFSTSCFLLFGLRPLQIPRNNCCAEVVSFPGACSSPAQHSS